MDDSGRSRNSSSYYWIISVSRRSRHQLLMLDYEGDEVLPIFSFREEACLYMRYGTRETERDVIRLSVEEILDLLLTGECRDADVIALDPMPEFRHERETMRLTLVSRNSFIGRLLDTRALWSDHSE